MMSASQSFTVTVVPNGVGDGGVDLPPSFTSVPSTIAVEGIAYSYQAVAVDPDNPTSTFTYSLTSTASGNMSVSSSGLLSWTPAKSEHGSVTVAIQAMASNGETATQTFTVNVLSNNVESSGGCGCVVGGHDDGRTAPLAFVLLLGGMALVWWRRRRSA